MRFLGLYIILSYNRIRLYTLGARSIGICEYIYTQYRANSCVVYNQTSMLSDHVCVCHSCTHVAPLRLKLNYIKDKDVTLSTVLEEKGGNEIIV